MKLAPYAKALVAMRMQGRVPRGTPVYGQVCVVLDCWDWRPPDTMPCHRIVVPQDREPAQLDWTCLVGLHVLLVLDARRSSIARAQALLGAIARAAPASIHVWQRADATVQAFSS